MPMPLSFIWPTMLCLLVLVVPLVVALYLLGQQRRQALTARHGTLGLVQARGRPLGRERHLAPGLFLLGLTILVCALARPQATISLPRIQGTVMLAFDVSGSMAATDVEPNRLEVAKTIARDFVLRQPPSVLVGVVAFSENGFAIQAPTNDQEAVLAAINRITPQRATSLGQGMIAALNTIAITAGQTPVQLGEGTPTPTPAPVGSDKSAIIILLTDGENNAPPDPLVAAQQAADRGVRIYPVGIGTATGTLLEVEGFRIHTQLDEATLQQVASLTQGNYYNATNQEELLAVYEDIDLQLVIEPEETEITAFVSGIGTLVLLIGGLYSLLRFGRLP